MNFQKTTKINTIEITIEFKGDYTPEELARMTEEAAQEATFLVTGHTEEATTELGWFVYEGERLVMHCADYDDAWNLE